MPSVGAVTCDIVRGDAPDLKERVDLWQTPGLDGYGAQTLGKSEAEATFLAIKFDTAAAVVTWFEAIEALQGTVATITNDWGDAYSVLIVEIEPRRRITAIQPGGSYDTRGELTLHCVTVS